MAKNILICGVGGQGTVLAAKVLSQAAISGGEHVLSAETIGMAQRGGSVTSHVRIGEGIFSPLIPKGQADIIISFEAAEAVRNIEYLKALIPVNNLVNYTIKHFSGYISREEARAKNIKEEIGKSIPYNLFQNFKQNYDKTILKKISKKNTLSNILLNDNKENNISLKSFYNKSFLSKTNF